MRQLLLAIAIPSALFAPVRSDAAHVIEKQGRLEVNWSSMRLRFFGEAKAAAGEDNYKEAEKEAWRDGLRYVTEAVRDLYVAMNEGLVKNTEQLSADARNAAQEISKSTFSFNTVYFADGTVRVHLESALPKALLSRSIRFRQREALVSSMAHHTGIELRLDQSRSPSPTYQIVDRGGRPLFEIGDMAEVAYQKNLMGRWFRKAKPTEMTSIIGKNPLRIEVSVDAHGRLVIDRKKWQEALEGHRSLLVNGQIALNMP